LCEAGLAYGQQQERGGPGSHGRAFYPRQPKCRNIPSKPIVDKRHVCRNRNSDLTHLQFVLGSVAERGIWAVLL
jgi:hypothetical protein